MKVEENISKARVELPCVDAAKVVTNTIFCCAVSQLYNDPQRQISSLSFFSFFLVEAP